MDVKGIEQAIHVIRGQRVLLDSDLARMYGVQTKALNQAIRRNAERFPEDFAFQLTEEETHPLRSQRVTSSSPETNISLRNHSVSSRSQIVTLNAAPQIGRGSNVKYRPYVFTEQGVAMLSSVLRSPRAVQVNIEIMRAFVRLRQMLQQNDELARKLVALEKKYDAQFRVVFDAIRELMEPPPEKPKKKIGF